MNNIREYQTIKFFRGSKRRIAELERLSEAKQDFEFRRLFIEENELDLHVYFSKMTVFNWLSWCFLGLAFYYHMRPIIITILFGLAILTRIISFFYARRFQLTFWRYNIALLIVDAVIFNDYGIRLS